MDKLPITVEPFMNAGIVPAVECVRCPNCLHEMPMSDVNTLIALDNDAGFSCRCGVRLHVKAPEPIVTVAAPVVDEATALKKSSKSDR